MESSYAVFVLYFGIEKARVDVIRDKREFFERWPERSYRLRPSEVSVDCQLNSCSVSGTVDWEVGSPSRRAQKRGEAHYQFEVAFMSSGQLSRLRTVK